MMHCHSRIIHYIIRYIITYTLYVILYRRSSTYGDSTHDFLTLRWCESNTHSVETLLRILNFDLSPGWQYMVHYSLLMLGSGSELHLLVSHTIRRVNNGYTYNHSVPRQPFSFSLSVQYSINYETLNTLL